jgi:hypothetical protein
VIRVADGDEDAGSKVLGDRRGHLARFEREMAGFEGACSSS